MIGFKIPGKEFLQLDSGTSLQATIHNPLFNVDEELSMYTFSQQAAKSRINKRLLGFPGLLSIRSYSREAIDCELWLGKSLQLFRIGKLNVLEADENAYKFNFQSDAGAIAAVKDDLLSDIPLGVDNLTLTVKQPYPNDQYALFPVKSPGFYNENADFCNYINYYDNGFKSNTTTAHQHSIVPFPYLAGIIKKVFSYYGYTVKGTWIDAPETCRLVIMNNYALDKMQNGINVYETGIDFRNHVPKVKVADFLKSLRKRLGLAYVFDTKAKEVKIVRLKEVMLDPAYDDWTEYTNRNYQWQVNQTNGFSLEYKVGEGENIYTVGKGKEKISSDCGSPEIRVEPDELKPGRSWLIPVMEESGTSTAYYQVNDFDFRILFYRGMQNDSEARQYPLGTEGVTDTNGLDIGTESIRWDSPKGLYQQAYKGWLDFLAESETVTRPVQLSLAKLMMLYPERKVWIRSPEGNVKALWKSIDFTVDHRTGIGSSKVTFYKLFN